MLSPLLLQAQLHELWTDEALLVTVGHKLWRDKGHSKRQKTK